MWNYNILMSNLRSSDSICLIATDRLVPFASIMQSPVVHPEHHLSIITASRIYEILKHNYFVYI